MKTHAEILAQSTIVDSPYHPCMIDFAAFTHKKNPLLSVDQLWYAIISQICPDGGFADKKHIIIDIISTFPIQYMDVFCILNCEFDQLPVISRRPAHVCPQRALLRLLWRRFRGWEKNCTAGGVSCYGLFFDGLIFTFVEPQECFCWYVGRKAGLAMWSGM